MDMWTHDSPDQHRRVSCTVQRSVGPCRRVRPHTLAVNAQVLGVGG